MHLKQCSVSRIRSIYWRIMLPHVTKKRIIQRAAGLLSRLLDKTERLLLSFCAAKNSRIQIKAALLTIFRRMENFSKMRWKGLFKIEIAWLSAALKVHSYGQCTSLYHPVSLKTPLLNFRLYFFFSLPWLDFFISEVRRGHIWCSPPRLKSTANAIQGREDVFR